MLDDLIFLAKLEDNIIVQKRLESIKELLETESNDLVLGGKLRAILR